MQVKGDILGRVNGLQKHRIMEEKNMFGKCEKVCISIVYVLGILGKEEVCERYLMLESETIVCHY